MKTGTAKLKIKIIIKKLSKQLCTLFQIFRNLYLEMLTSTVALLGALPAA